MESSIKRIVVGVDGSAEAAAALAWAGPIAARATAEIVAVNAFENPWSEVAPDDRERFIKERATHMTNEWLQPAINAGATVVPIVRPGDPRRAVLDVAEGEATDLIVLGRSGKNGGPGFLHLGSVAEHAAHHMQQPLAVIPSTTTPIERIMVGIDGSDDSLHALQWGAELARLFNATLVAVAVQEPFPEGTPTQDPQHLHSVAASRVDHWTAPIAEQGIHVDHVIQTGFRPADGLLHVASERNGDVLVVGARGTGGFSGLRAGGVAMKVLHRTTLPVVLVPRPG